MPLNFTAAHSSRIRKKPNTKPALLNRSSTAPYSRIQKHRAPSRSKSLDEAATGDVEAELDGSQDNDIGTKLALSSASRTLVEAISLGRSSMFDELPASGGFNSVQIQEVLNFRKRLPPVVAKSHVHALLASPTATERELSRNCRAGTVQRLTIAGRGMGTSNIGEVLVLTHDIHSMLDDSTEVSPHLREKFGKDLRSSLKLEPSSCAAYSMEELRSLMRSGFLISKSAVETPFNSVNPFGSSFSGAGTSIVSVSKAPSGSVAAVGGADALSLAGGGANSQVDRPQRQQDRRLSMADLQVWVPGIGAYLKLAGAARSHLLTLLLKSPGRQSPLYLLKEKWDGAILGDDAASKAKKYRGDFAGVLPARTRKWKSFYGLSFDWILAECVGAGIIELFETGSVGQAARVV